MSIHHARSTDAAVRRLALVTDAWYPQTNGVVHTLVPLIDFLKRQNIDVLVIEPDAHRTFAMPQDGDYRLACDPWRAIPRIASFAPDAVHIATEGPLGLWTNMWLRRRGMRFTTSFHTRFPEYLHARFGIPVSWGYRVERWFHRAAEHTFVGTRSMMRELESQRVGRELVHWPRGVDTARFSPQHRRDEVYAGLPGPIWLYVGRVAAEKNIREFLDLNLPGTKVVVGDGPAREELSRSFPETEFRGWQFGTDLSAHFASADCFVFPSRTDTFGNVILEALASGLPVAAVPAPGPLDLIEDGENGAVDIDLGRACLRALRCDAGSARSSAERYTLRRCHEIFRDNLVPCTHRLPAMASPALSGLGEAVETVSA